MTKLTRVFITACTLLAAIACGPVRAPEVIPVPPPRVSDHRPGLQTHFGTPIGRETVLEIARRGFTYARIDAQRSDATRALAMIDEARAAGLRPLVIVGDPLQLEQLPDGLDYELRNEPDLNGPPSPQEYADRVHEAASIARERGQRLWIGAISNLNSRGFTYLQGVFASAFGVPADVGVSVHRYGDGSFDAPHTGFASREAEVHKLLNLIGDRKFAVTEFGYPTNGLTEAEQAARIAEEFRFWARMGAEFSILYQLSDGPGSDEKYGIRRQDGTWKPSATVVEPPPVVEPDPVPEATVAVLVHSTTGRPLKDALVISSCRFLGTTNEDGYVAWQVKLIERAPGGEPARACSFSAHLEGYADTFGDGLWITGNTDIRLSLKPLAPPYPFQEEKGWLRVDGTTFRTETGELWQWRGFSWFLGYRRFLAGEDVTSDLRALRSMGVNIVRVFGPLPWAETPDYRQETFNTDRLGEFFDLLADHGLRVEFVPICYSFDLAAQRRLVQRVYEIASEHWNVLIEVANEPHVNKTDPIAILKGVNRHGVLSAYGLYGSYYAKPASMPPVLDYVTIHTQRDTAWHRKARHAQEVQEAVRAPTISDEPAKITEPGFNYPGGKNDLTRTPAEAVWHGAITHLWTPGFTLHTEEGKWGRVPTPGMLQYTVAADVLEHVWRRIGPAWQAGKYNGSHMSSSPVDFIQDVWTYTSLHASRALAVRAAFSPPQAVRGWRVVDRWGPAGSLVVLER